MEFEEEFKVTRCLCGRVCCSCGYRPPEFETTYGPMCGSCVGNGQAEPDTEEATDHVCEREAV